jgi:hypothetical protein
LWFRVSSLAVERTLTVSYGRSTLGVVRVFPNRQSLLRVKLPPGRGVALIRLSARPPAQPPGRFSPGDSRRLAIRLDDLSAIDTGPPRDTTEAIYERVKRRAGVSALQGSKPGVVDNLYLAWLYQYGFLLGVVLCVVWALVLLRPALERGRDDDALVVTMRLWGLFVVVAALVVNIWEEFPVDFLVALGFAFLYGSKRARAEPR